MGKNINFAHSNDGTPPEAHLFHRKATRRMQALRRLDSEAAALLTNKDKNEK